MTGGPMEASVAQGGIIIVTQEAYMVPAAEKGEVPPIL